jgi:hypothetical protein
MYGDCLFFLNTGDFIGRFDSNQKDMNEQIIIETAIEYL